jgi:hypothetical protein
METQQPKTKPPKLELPEIKYNDPVSFVETKLLYLSTRSSSGTVLNGDAKSHVIYDLRSYINYEDDPTVQYVSISLPYVSMVNSNYIVTQYTNTLEIQGSGYLKIEIPVGNYTVDDLTTYLQTTLAPYSFTVTFNTRTLKYTFTNSSFAFYFLASSTADYIVGFSGVTTSTATAPYTLEMPRLVNLLPTPSYQIIAVGGTMYNGLILAPNGMVQQSNVLASIPNIGKQTTTLIYRNDGQEFRLSSLSQTTLELMLLDNENRLVDFNGLTTFMCLKINIHRKIQTIKSKFTDMLERAITTRINTEIDNEM